MFGRPMYDCNKMGHVYELGSYHCVMCKPQVPTLPDVTDEEVQEAADSLRVIEKDLEWRQQP